MKKNIKKIMATTLLTASAVSCLGCGTTNTKIAQKINNGVNEFVSSINKLDYVDTKKTNSNLGKIVSAVSDTQFLNNVTSTNNIENTITKPSERSDSFKLYTLSATPYISLTSDDNNINLSIQFSTSKIETASDNIDEKINQLILKRAILMVYVNEIYNGNVTLTDENRKAINAYVNVIKENASFLNGNRGMVKNQLDMASNLINTQSNDEIVNYYIIKSGEALEIRSNKIDSTISSIDSIISILENNLSPSSCYYQNNLTTSYEQMLNNLKNENLTSENSKLAKEIAESINLLDTSSPSQNIQEVQNNQNSLETQNNTRINKNTQNSTTNTITQKSINGDTINSQVNNTQSINRRTVRQTENNVNSMQENQIQTLEETKHDTTINETTNNNQTPNQTKNYTSTLTPSQRARIRRQRNQHQTENINRQPNATNPTMNPGSLNKSIYNDSSTQTPRTLDQTRNTNQNKTINNTRSKATRVPYSISSTDID